jgi:citrate lyase subunit beta/citryl-CoA lyase
VILAANAAGVQPIGRPGNPFDFNDVAAQEETARRGFALGFKGSACIHPLQVEPLNRGYMPSPAQVEKARRTIEVMAEASARGRASASLDGRMIDIPSAVRAERLLTRMKAIEEKDARKAALRS